MLNHPSAEANVLAGLVSQLPIGLITTDVPGRVVFMNPAAQEILGRLFGPIEGAGSRHPVLPPQIKEAITYLRRLLASEQTIYRRPFPLLTLKHAGPYELHIFPYVLGETLSWQQRNRVRIVILAYPAKRERMRTRRWSEYGLTPREVEVLQHLARGKARKEMAALLNLSEETVRTHLRNAYRKLQVTNQLEAAAVVLKIQLVEELEHLITGSG